MTKIFNISFYGVTSVTVEFKPGELEEDIEDRALMKFSNLEASTVVNDIEEVTFIG